MITRRGFMKVLGGGLVSAVALGSYAFGIEPLARLRVARYALTPPGWSPGLKLRLSRSRMFMPANPGCLRAASHPYASAPTTSAAT